MLIGAQQSTQNDTAEVAKLDFSPVPLENLLSGHSGVFSEVLLTGSVPCLPRATLPVVAYPLEPGTPSPSLMATVLPLAFQIT